MLTELQRFILSEMTLQPMTAWDAYFGLSPTLSGIASQLQEVRRTEWARYQSTLDAQTGALIGTVVVAVALVDKPGILVMYETLQLPQLPRVSPTSPHFRFPDPLYTDWLDFLDVV